MNYIETFGNETLAESIAENKADERATWLSKHSSAEGDVMEDEKGEYIIGINENGNPGEDGYSIDKEKIYLDEMRGGLLGKMQRLTRDIQSDISDITRVNKLIHGNN